jgi:transcriptional regulator with XRE-family HTH domain
MTQEDLAEHCGLFRTYVSRIETGVANPTLTMITALATRLKVSVPEMFEDSRTPVPRPIARTDAQAAAPNTRAPAASSTKLSPTKPKTSRGRVTR